MDAKFKAEWCKRLREPERIQGHAMLCSADKEQCCLDIANEIAVEWGAQQAPVLDRSYFKGPAFGYPTSGQSSDKVEDFGRYVDKEYNFLTVETMRLAGLTNSNPKVKFTRHIDYENDYEDEATLAELNDDWNYPLPKIADIIEESDL